MITWKKGYPPIYEAVTLGLNLVQKDENTILALRDDSFLGSYKYSDIATATITIDGGTAISLEWLDTTVTDTGTITTGTTTLTVSDSSIFTTDDYIFIEESGEVIKIASISNATTIILETWSIGATASTVMKFNYPIELSESLSDGIHTIVYNIIMDDGEEFEKQIDIFSKHTVECCINTKIAGIPNAYKDCGCSAKYISNTVTVYGLWISLQSLIAYGKFTEATSILSTLQRICQYDDCNC